MEYLLELYSSSTQAWLSAILLGLMTAISPCPLATNITAVGFISKDVENRNRVFFNGLFYTLGRAIGYTGLALVLYLGADQLALSEVFQRYGEKIIGPVLIIVGLIMLDVFRVNFPGLNKLTARMEQKKSWGYIDALLLGVVFALAFCPYSGVLFFGLLIPMTITSGMHLPVLFALATGIPVVIFAWLFAYAFSNISKFYNNLKAFEKWFRRVIAVLFIVVGIYTLIQLFV